LLLKEKQLKKLNISGNALRKIPGSIGELAAIEVIDAKHNELSKLPIEVGNLATLKKFDLSHNMLTELPWELGNLEKTVKLIDVNYNPLVIPPRPVVDKGTGAMLNWLVKNEEKGRKAKVSGLGLKT